MCRKMRGCPRLTHRLIELFKSNYRLFVLLSPILIVFIWSSFRPNQLTVTHSRKTFSDCRGFQLNSPVFAPSHVYAKDLHGSYFVTGRGYYDRMFTMDTIVSFRTSSLTCVLSPLRPGRHYRSDVLWSPFQGGSLHRGVEVQRNSFASMSW